MDVALPTTAQVIAEVIGESKAVRLARAVSHRSLYIPKTLKPSHWIVKAIGSEAAEKLVEEFPSMLMPLAKCSRIEKVERNKKIAELSQRGMSATEIADLMGLNRNTVQSIRYRMKIKKQ